MNCNCCNRQTIDYPGDGLLIYHETSDFFPIISHISEINAKTISGSKSSQGAYHRLNCYSSASQEGLDRLRTNGLQEVLVEAVAVEVAAHERAVDFKSIENGPPTLIAQLVPAEI